MILVSLSFSFSPKYPPRLVANIAAFIAPSSPVRFPPLPSYFFLPTNSNLIGEYVVYFASTGSTNYQTTQIAF